MAIYMSRVSLDDEGLYVVIPDEIAYPLGTEVEIDCDGEVITIRPTKDAAPAL